MANKVKLDFAKIALTAGGEAAGLAVTTVINRVPFVAKQKPSIKGLILVGIGKVVLPYLAQSMGMTGTKKDQQMGDLITGAGNAMSVCGIAMLGNEFAPNAFPKISGVGGYEDGVYGTGMGMIADEDIAGTDDDISGTADVYE